MQLNLHHKMSLKTFLASCAWGTTCMSRHTSALNSDAYFHSSGTRPFLHECISLHTDTQPSCVNESVCKGADDWRITSPLRGHTSLPSCPPPSSSAPACRDLRFQFRRDVRPVPPSPYTQTCIRSANICKTLHINLILEKGHKDNSGM